MKNAAIGMQSIVAPMMEAMRQLQVGLHKVRWPVSRVRAVFNKFWLKIVRSDSMKIIFYHLNGIP